MAVQTIASASVSVITGVGSTAAYAHMQEYPPIPTYIQVGTAGASALFSTIYIMETRPHLSFPKASAYGTALAGGFYCVGGAIGAGISLLSNNNKSRHADV